MASDTHNHTGHGDVQAFEFEPALGPVVTFRQRAPSGSNLLENTWPVKLDRVPTVLAAAHATTRACDADKFWWIISRSTRPTVVDSLLALINDLRKLPLEEVLEFQATLYEEATRLVKRRSCRWAAAGLAILSSRDRFEGVMSGELPVADSAGWEFEDLLDAAEIALNAGITLPDSTTSRSASRDKPPTWPEDFDLAALHREFGLDVPEWDALPWRWEGWRATCSDEFGELDVVLIANRTWTTGLAQMAAAIENRIAESGAILQSLPQVVFPELRRPMLGMPPFFIAKHPGRMPKF